MIDDMKIKTENIRMIVVVMLLLPTVGITAGSMTSVKEAELKDDAVFARINDLIISKNEFQQIFHGAVRNKYYHGRVPENKLQNFKQQVTQDIVEQALVYQDALKLGVKPDRDSIKQGIAAYDEKYADSPDWRNLREKVLDSMLKILERKDVIEKMESRVKKVAKPDITKVQRYYQQHPDKFTEPRREWISVILFGVPPSGNRSMWASAGDSAKQIKQRIEQGEEFADLAKQFSAHPSAINGGDMGYLHQGMLEKASQNAVENLKVGEISEPLRVLEGIIIIRLNGVHSAKLKPFEEVKERAAGLAHRKVQETAWNEYVRSLKASADIYINENTYALK